MDGTGGGGAGPAAGPPASPALELDLYEVTMAAAYHAEGLADVPASFSLFVRNLPPSTSFLVAAGLEDALAFLESFCFGPGDLAALDGLGLFDDAFLEMLAAVRFSGAVRAIPEGRVALANEPLLEVDATLATGQLVETALLAMVGHQTALATRAARLRLAAADRSVADFGLRSTPWGAAGMRLARAARIAGMDSTSNVAAAGAYGLPVSGTMAHSYVQAHEDEASAFESFAERFGSHAVLLVDTYDTDRGLAHAVEVARRMRQRGVELAGVRIDSGDLAAGARRARRVLDEAGFGQLKVFLTGGLDEFQIEELVAAGTPVDGFGVGAALANPGPALEAAYKLVEVGGRPVRKRSPGKVSWPGRKQVWRLPSGADVLTLAEEDRPASDAEPLLAEVMAVGRRTAAGRQDVAAAADRFRADLGWLPGPARRIRHPEPPQVQVGGGLRRLAQRLDADPSGR
ncbi:MAG TPA: nicotinate phosphoribosyltransferase [Acidimicrobiales bacterium]|nr:nicotinate phosphoribosyltransferase [Acidimicrobiales bacterium]